MLNQKSEKIEHCKSEINFALQLNIISKIVKEFATKPEAEIAVRIKTDESLEHVKKTFVDRIKDAIRHLKTDPRNVIVGTVSEPNTQSEDFVLILGVYPC